MRLSSGDRDETGGGVGSVGGLGGSDGSGCWRLAGGRVGELLPERGRTGGGEESPSLRC